MVLERCHLHGLPTPGTGTLAAEVGLDERGAMTAEEIIEKIMTRHWDMDACRCWICEAGRALRLRPRPRHLHDDDPMKPYTHVVETE